MESGAACLEVLAMMGPADLGLDQFERRAAESGERHAHLHTARVGAMQLNAPGGRRFVGVPGWDPERRAPGLGELIDGFDREADVREGEDVERLRRGWVLRLHTVG